MILDMSCYGEILLSRSAGHEAIIEAFSNNLGRLNIEETITLDFSKIKILTPAWADEFITGLKAKYKSVDFINIENPAVKASLNFLLEPIDVLKYRKD